jgi:hypothetical protein
MNINIDDIDFEKFESNEIMKRVSNDVNELFNKLNSNEVSDEEKVSIENWFMNMRENFR